MKEGRKTRPKKARRRIEYQANAVAVVCKTMQAIAAMSEPIEIVVIVSQRLWNQPRRSQPRRSAAAPITKTITAHSRNRDHNGRARVAGVGASCAAAVMPRS